MFDHCSNFTISGGAFAQPEWGVVRPSRSLNGGLLHPPHDFHSIRLGDLNLLDEIGAEEVVEYRDVRRRRTGVLLRRERVVTGTRRIHQARVLGKPGVVTAVIYQGTDLERVSYSNDRPPRKY